MHTPPKLFIEGKKKSIALYVTEVGKILYNIKLPLNFAQEHLNMVCHIHTGLNATARTPKLKQKN